MSGLWRILGYDEVALALVEDLEQSHRLALLQGPPGVGKSWLSKGIGALWQRNGGSTVIAEGDRVQSDFGLYPFGFALAGLSAGWDDYAPVATSIARVVEAALGTGGLITSTIEGISSISRGRREPSAVFLEERELTVLHELERLGHGRPILLIADNLHWWDARSLRLLSVLLDSRLQEAFPFLRSIRVLLVQTMEPYQRVAHPSQHAAVVSLAVNRRELERVPLKDFGDVLDALGLQAALGPDAVNTIHSFTGGHLTLARRAAMHINDVGAGSLLDAARASEFVVRLLTERMSELGELGVDAVGLLEVAALLGLAFRREELLCASPLGESETVRLLAHVNEEEVLQTVDETCRFAHDLLREHFFEAGESGHGQHRLRLADCLRRLRPADYQARALNALGAGLDADARALTVQAVLAEIRAGRDWRAMPGALVDLASEGDTAAAVDALASAYELLAEYRRDECLAEIERTPYSLGKAVRAEADYLRARCLLSTRSEVDRERAREILSVWSGLEEEEFELGTRLLRLLVYGLSHLRDKTSGRELEARLQMALSERAAFDEFALDELHVLDRCSGSLVLPDMSLVRCRRAAEYFAPPAGQLLPRRPAEYYRCLSNLIAKLISNGLYREAVDTVERLERLLAQYGEDAFPRPEFARMNANLALYRAGDLSAEAAARTQEELHQRLRNDGDPYYGANALAVFRALAGNAQDASHQLADLHRVLLRRRAEPEPSMSYLLQSNATAIDYVTGADPAHCLERWNALESVLAAMPYMITPMLQRRHELLGRLMASGQSVTPVEFDEHALGAAPGEFGRLWDNFGRGFRLPEIEFWRDS